MASVRLPVCGDYVEAMLVRGVSARGAPGEPSYVTVWVAGQDDNGTALHCFQQFQVPNLEDAQRVRDEIAELCYLTPERQEELDRLMRLEEAEPPPDNRRH